jgi:hypothetical protein
MIAQSLPVKNFICRQIPAAADKISQISALFHADFLVKLFGYYWDSSNTPVCLSALILIK